MQRLYFDNNASTPIDPVVREAMAPYLEDFFGNPSSGHWFGERARAGIDEARSRVAGLLNCHATCITFTSGGTEANNLAIWSAVAAQPDKKHIITSQVEHASVLTPILFLENRFGYRVDILPVGRHGELDLAQLSAAVRPDTALVSLMGANNETGVIWPINEIGELCRANKVLFHCDAVQMAGKEELDVNRLPVDYLALAGHKLHGPKGVGCLYVHRTAPVTPLIMGADQEAGRRAGTENVAGIVGFGKACELAGRDAAGHRQQVGSLRDFMEEQLLKEVPDAMVNGHGQPRLANTLNISFRYCSSAALIQELDSKGIAVSAHSACQSGDLDPSHVLRALEVPEEFMHGTLRISLSKNNTQAEVERLLALLPGMVAKSRDGFAR